MLTLLIAFTAWLLLTTIEITVFRVDAVETIPVNACALMLTLYVLAFFDELSCIDAVECAIIVVCIAWIAWKKQLSGCFAAWKESFRSGGILVMVSIMVIVVVGMLHKHIAAYDDVKFWAASVKSLFFQNGFGAPYRNIASQFFGDYPLGSSFIQWYFEHLSGDYHENLLYIAQAIFSFSFLSPLAKRMPKKWYVIPSSILIILFSGAFTRFGMSLAPDRTMALMFGGALILVLESVETGNVFYRIAFAVYLGAICQMKSVGFIWALFALAFFIYYHNGCGRKRVFQTIQIAMLPAAVEISWRLYCSILGRVSYLAENAYGGLQLGVGEQVLHIKNHFYIVSMFFKELLLGSINSSSFYEYRSGLNLSVVGFFILFSVIFLFLWKKNLFPSDKLKKIYIYSVCVCAIYYLILLWGFLFMFTEEFTGENTGHMINLISRYGGPGLIGSWMLLFKIILDFPISEVSRWNSRKYQWATAACLCLLIVNIPYSCVTLFGHNWGSTVFETNDKEIHYYRDEYKDVVKQSNQIANKNDARILYCDSSKNLIDYSFLHYYLSPISTIDWNDVIDEQTLSTISDDSHCNYVFIADSYLNDGGWLSDLCSGSFKFNTIYHIDYVDGEMTLIPLN